MELESLKLQAQEEIKRRDEQLSHVKELLYKAMVERDEALEKCQSLQFEKQSLLLQQQQQQVNDVKISTLAADPLSGVSSIEDHINNNLTSSDCDDQSIVSSPATDQPIHNKPNVTQKTSSKLQSFHEEVMQKLLPNPLQNSISKKNYTLPEKGKLLEAVMNAGPLLQTLLLAGPLPQWKHPPPPLESFEIPLVTININNNRSISRKRSLLNITTHCSDSSTDHPQTHKVQKQLKNSNTFFQQ